MAELARVRNLTPVVCSFTHLLNTSLLCSLHRVKFCDQETRYKFHQGSLKEGGGRKLPRNIGKYLSFCSALRPRILESSLTS